MYFNKEYIEAYERRFNAYIMRIIKNEYLDYLRCCKKKEISLNELNGDGVELIDLIVGETDVCYKDDFDDLENLLLKGRLSSKYNELEMVFKDTCVYNAVKSLTEKEKLAIFLCKVLEIDKKEMAKELGVKCGDSAMRIYRKAIDKVRNNIMNNGGYKND